jgi:hypothetical protein
MDMVMGLELDAITPLLSSTEALPASMSFLMYVVTCMQRQVQESCAPCTFVILAELFLLP